MFADRTPSARAAVLTSPKNPLLKDIRRAVERGSLTGDGLCVAETFHLLEEALRSGCEVPVVISSLSVRSAVERHIGRLRGVHTIHVSDDLFSSLSATETSQGVMALVRPPVWTLDSVFRGQSLVVVLDGIQDPGNAGAILRAAEAFGASGAIFVKGSVNPYNPKAVRSSAGSVFRLPLIPLDESLTLTALEHRRVDVYAATPRAAQSIADVDLTRRCALIIGSEGRGVRPTLEGAATGVKIPTSGVESLNAAVAAGVLLYEAARQRHMPA